MEQPQPKDQRPNYRGPLSYSTALTIVPPADCWDSIQALRSKYDKGFNNWMPHINVFHPFMSPDSFYGSQNEVFDGLMLVTCGHAPISIKLDRLEIFEHGKKGCSLTLIPNTVAESELKSLHRVLELRFPLCNSAWHGGYHPHLTVGQFSDRAEAEKVLREIQPSWRPVEFTMSELQLLVKQATGLSFTLHRAFPFSAGLPPHLTLLPKLPASPSPAPETIHTTQHHVFKYGSAGWAPVMTELTSSSVQSLTVATWNVLYDLHNPAALCTAPRIPHILRHLRDTNAHIIALQEVTRSFLTALLETDWIRERYYLSEVAGTTITPYGQVVLSTLPFALSLHSFSAQKKLVLAEFSLNSRKVLVPVVHLSSDLSKNAEQQRAMQVELVRPYPDALIIGDFNMADDGEKLRADFSDAWKTLKPEDEGITFDPSVNFCAAITSKSGLRRRFDRVLLRSNRWRPQDISLFGTSAIEWGSETTDPAVRAARLFPSDHYGIRCVLAWDEQMAVDNTDEVKCALDEYSLFETEHAISSKQRVIGQISKLLGFASPQECLVTAAGSFRLGVHSRDSDLDLICLGRLPIKEFFSQAQKSLSAQSSGVSGLRAVPDALIPILSFCLSGVEIDLQYVYVPESELSRALVSLPADEVKRMDDKSLLALNAVREADTILRLVPSAPAFRLLLHFVKHWAKQRNLYGNRLGSLPGMAWTLLAARTAQANPGASSRALIAAFFDTWSAWDWTSKFVSLLHTDPPVAYTMEARDLMAIICPCKPFRNSARNLTPSTRAALIREFARAAPLAHVLLNSEYSVASVLKKLCEPLSFFSQYEHYAQIAVSALNKKDFATWTGYIEGKFVELLMKLEASHIGAFPLLSATPNPGSAFPFSQAYWIGLQCPLQEARNAVATLLDHLGTYRKMETMDAVPRLLSAAEVAHLVTHSAANGTEEEEEEQEEAQQGSASVASTEDEKKPAYKGNNTKGRWAPWKQKNYKKVDPSTLQGNESVPKNQKMRTAIEAFNRIKWDEDMDKKDVVIGFEDRFLGIVETPWNEFDTEVVPLHRLRFFKYRGHVIYDRVQRVDILFQHRKDKHSAP